MNCQAIAGGGRAGERAVGTRGRGDGVHGAGFWRVARMYTAMPATATTAPPIKTATVTLMASEATRSPGPPARCESR